MKQWDSFLARLAGSCFPHYVLPILGPQLPEAASSKWSVLRTQLLQATSCTTFVLQSCLPEAASRTTICQFAKSVSRETSSKTHAKSTERAFCARLLPKITGQVSKTSISFEAAFRRRLAVEVTCEVSKASVSFQTSFKSEAGSLIRVNTLCSPAKQFRIPSPSQPHPLTHQSHCHSDIHLHQTSQPHNSLRLPRKFNFKASNTHKILHLPRKVTI